MKNYASSKTHRGRVAYRTPSSFRYRIYQKIKTQKVKGH